MECTLPTCKGIVKTMLVVMSFIVAQQMQTLPQRKDACGDDGVCNCSSEGKHYRVTCAGKNLRQLPEHIPFNTTHLNISWNQIRELPQDTTLKTRKLKELKPNILQSNPNSTASSYQAMTTPKYRTAVEII
ncbi:hypothetical protein HOLleu_02219 [Holothuria leucospilota]|uniref:Uncharacterized protein n=1 Tax=Holothuria leucospilota TaxID=206669 RepID=A0A9Q1CS26_HOLLE|nr:hypothetical protein HOLleu_02219 [Holothuria leucospilota]